jgi:hypothetical protein
MFFNYLTDIQYQTLKNNNCIDEGIIYFTKSGSVYEGSKQIAEGNSGEAVSGEGVEF